MKAAVSSRLRLLRASVLALAAASIAPLSVHAQRRDSIPASAAPEPSEGDTVSARSAKPRSVQGRIVRPGEKGPITVPGVWVVLHRVGADRQGPLDSVRSSAAGSYALRYTPSGRNDALYFVSVRYAGIAYFSSPLRSAVVRGEEGEITVYDTTSA